MNRLVLILFLLMLAGVCQGQHVLSYGSPARFFEEALPIGNGTLGGMVYGGVGVDSITLNDITLWTGEPAVVQYDSVANARVLERVRKALFEENYREADSLQRLLQGPYSQNYQPLGTLTIDYHRTSIPSLYRRSLLLDSATVRTDYMVGDDAFSVRYYCSRPDGVMVVDIENCDSGRVAFTLGLDSQLPHSTSLSVGEIVVDGYAAYHSLPHYLWSKHSFWYDPSRGTHFRTIVKVVGADEIEKCDNDRLNVKGKGRITLLLSNATSFKGYDQNPCMGDYNYCDIVRRRINNALALGTDSLYARMLEDHAQLYSRVDIDLGSTPDSVLNYTTDMQLLRYMDLEEMNPDLEETYFNYGRYLLICCSRTMGVPATLQGLWNEHVLPPWSSNYTTNINLAENYWLAEVANLSELHRPLLDFLKNCSSNGAHTARGLFGVSEGWCLGHNSDIWAMTNPVGAKTGDPVWANWNMGGAWLSSHIWEHYLFSRDYSFLKEYYPVLCGAARFCVGWLVEKDGYLLTAPATSPENKYITSEGYAGATLYGATADIAIIRQCLMDAKQAAQMLGRDSGFVDTIDAVLRRLPPYRIGANRNLQEWYHDWADAEPTHRHQSHLYGLYPGHSICDSMLIEACRRTLELKGTETTGWSTGWRINLYARMGDGEMAYMTLRNLLRYVSADGYQGADARRGGGTYPNLMDAHSPFQIDGNFGGCAGIAEMLLQSTENGYKLLPAIPKAWPNGYVKGLRTRTGETIDIYWRDGKVTLSTATK